jgi:hypothetical protein
MEYFSIKQRYLCVNKLCLLSLRFQSWQELEVSKQLHVSVGYPPEKVPSTHWIESGRIPEPVWTQQRKE